MTASDAPDHQRHGEHDHGYRKAGGQAGVHCDTGIAGAFRQVGQEADHVIADGRNREPFHGLLQPQLRLSAAVHRLEEIAVLLLKLDIDARAQEVGGARQLARQAFLPIGDGAQVRMAGAMRRARKFSHVS